MSRTTGATILLCLLALAALPLPHAAAASSIVTGDATVWASFNGWTCSNWSAASFTGVLSGSAFTASLTEGSTFKVETVGSDVEWTTTARSSPCSSVEMPVLSTSVDCAAGTAQIVAGVQGSLGLTIDVTNLQCDASAGGGDALCFDYNPSALTNACVTTGQQPENVPSATPVVGSQTVGVPTPVVGTTSQVVCVIGNECATLPVPHAGVGSTPETIPDVGVQRGTQVVEVPTVGGYVEVTACGTSLCHVSL